MEDIKITKNERGCFFIEKGDMISDELGYEEMLGLITALTMPDDRPCLQWMKEKVKYKPQDGDFVTYVYNEGLYIAIVKGNDNRYYASYQKIGDRNAVPTYELQFLNGYIVRRPATEEEKRLILSKLHEIGKDWDAEKKEIVDWKWKPKKNERYFSIYFFCIDFAFATNCYTWFNDPNDILAYERDLVFKTKEEAAKKAQELNEKLFGKNPQ